MSVKRKMMALTLITSLAYGLISCFKAPYNNFRTDRSTPRTAATGAAIGTVAGLVSGYVVPGVGIGAAAGTAIGMYRDSKRGIIAKLREQSIEYVEYGSTMTLIIPTDKYYLFNESNFNDLYFEGFNAIIKLLKYYPKSPIYVAAFSDNIGSRKNKRYLTQARAETMLTFLWGNGIKSAQLLAEGYGDDFAISDNVLIHGSAENRRIEIQWFKCMPADSSPMLGSYLAKD